VSEKGGEGEAVCSETPSLLSYILRYVSFAKLPCCVARPHGFLPQLDEFYFTTAEKKPRWLKEKTSQGGRKNGVVNKRRIELESGKKQRKERRKRKERRERRDRR
jgi:hypothetical protein